MMSRLGTIDRIAKKVFIGIVVFIATLVLAIIPHTMFFPNDVYYLFNLIVAVIVTTMVLFYYPRKKNSTTSITTDNPYAGNYPSGFGGWLILFSLGLAYQFFANLKAFYDNYLTLGSETFEQLTDITSDYYNSLWQPTVIYEMIVQSVSAVTVLIIAFLLITKSKKLKFVAITYIAALIPLMAIELFLMLSIQNSYDEELFTSNQLYSQIIRSVSYAIVWIPYMIFSKRVNNTYTMK